ncbi:SMN family protein Smn1 [Schizosaccharomyces cryophilus OY26]|uniref:SMN family protein Smn1 n=1 Tax=Schizosaccharomyces cryophilus (strain OY26 / ATCC MYA-4695 / CBS 11777 / NBRC 106824 / NRRL Y48691) TaxID=653667 RepID=S9XA69_SCHCR|nr:SMN family protein Smn1 [Schizosaccharomyces cryophilus OY26]EPY54057.1 SMN family protein Smn1 [Schizosaccharomyces cryophilus OY26]
MNSQKEVWDDSELRNAYEAALAEYKKYHSLEAEKAREEKQETNKAGYMDREQEDSGMESDTKLLEKEEEDEGEIQEEERMSKKDVSPNPSHGPEKDISNVPITSSSANSEDASTIPPPPPILGLTYDESYRRLLMSWYYAGYYAGLAQGMHQSQP